MKCGLGTEPVIIALGVLSWVLIFGLIAWVVTR